MRNTIQNPLLPGFHPDPSILRVGEDYYMVTSSFSFYPGVPIFHSRDLAHWEQIGYVLDRPSQLPLNPDRISGGIYAPTLRFHDGLYYMITTNVSDGGNFIVTAEKPEGPWSECHWLADCEGIDPSIFWDDDGRAYYTGTAAPKPGIQDEQMIWCQELDLKEFKLIGEKKLLWAGAMRPAAWPEGPHIYKKDGYYYLMIAEGGTEHFHSESIARAESVWGPYESFRGNPFLTQRHLGMSAKIANTGHADLVECADGSWYIVFLASRPYGGYHKNLGRETFIAPVTWEEGWPVVAAGEGRIAFSYEGPEVKEAFVVPEIPEKDDFDDPKPAFCWNTLGTPDKDTFKIEDGKLKLKLYARPFAMDMTKTGRPKRNEGIIPSTMGFFGRRQEHMSFDAKTEVYWNPKDKQTAGIAVLQNDFASLRVEIGLNAEGKKVARAIRGYRTLTSSLLHLETAEPYREDVLAEVPFEGEKAILGISAKEQAFALTVSDEQGNETVLVPEIDGGFMGSETCSGFIGAYVGMFASGNGTEYDEYVPFEYFTYKGLD